MNSGWEAKFILRKRVKGIGQGPTYKQKLLGDLRSHWEFKKDFETSICSQYRLKDLQEEQASIQQILGQVLRQ